MKRLVSVLMVAAFALAAPVHAVTSYSCDFETKAQRDRWVLTPTANPSIANQIKNKWYIGAPGDNSRSGEYGLYISNDGGLNAQYEATGCWVYAYDTISLDPISGDYTIYFDYMAMANDGNDAFDGLYLLWIPMYKEDGVTPIKVFSSPNGGSIPSGMDEYIIRLQPGANIDNLYGAASWRQCAATIKGSDCDGTPHYLAFVWTNGSLVPKQPGGVVDNIDITDNQPCDAPSNIKITQSGKTVLVSWTGTQTATEYEVSAYSYDADSWAGPMIVQGTSTQFSNLASGQTDIIVRAKCDDYHYSLKAIESKLIYYPDEMCVDYLTLSNAVCYVNNSSPSDAQTFNDFTVVPAVDKGPSNSLSRHVVHFNRQETDPRTGGLAKTVPDGEFASVRLGNWESGNEAERIEFSFQVDTIKHPVLLLKYLPVLEAPGHGITEDPRFKLDLLVNNQTIGSCGQADFTCLDVWTGSELKPGAASQGWHVYTPQDVDYAEPIVWKEWTTVGVNLKKYATQGATITARLTTHDCTWSGHFGYAYFALSCSDGKFKDMKCGQINPDFMAPDGFEYRWAYAYNERYRRADGSLPEKYILGRDQQFVAGMNDDSLYVVDCMFVQDSTCFFSLYASTLATNPISVMNEPKIIRSCRDNIYKVEFDASPSWVQEIDHVTGDTLVSENYHIERYEWTIEGMPAGFSSWSDEIKPTFNFPIEGGHFVVNLRTTCGTCESVLTHHLFMDPLSETRDTIVDVLCDDLRKTGYVWSEKPDTLYHTYGLDSIILFNEITSCDSIIYLQLVEPVRIFEDTMIMQTSLPFTYHGRVYPEGTVSMIDTVPSPTNCDTTYVLNLEVYEPLQATMPQAYILCEGDDSLRLVYSISRGRSLRYSYGFAEAGMPSLAPVTDMQKKGDYAIAIPIDASIIPDVYNGFILLEDSLPQCNVRLPFVLTLQYASTVIAQRWNDVLAIKNADFNGGYSFDSVQWYVSGMPIEGATEFNYYAGKDKQLRFGEEYQALLTRADGVKLFTCAFVPSPVPAEVTDMPSLVPLGQPIPVEGQGVAQWFDMLGRIHHTEAFHNSDIYAPAAAGSYLLVLQTEANRSAHHIVVR